MENSHLISIIDKHGSIEDIDKKIFTLKEFNGESEDIDIIDPYYASNETYKQVLKIIDQNVEKAIKKIIDINNSFCV